VIGLAACTTDLGPPETNALKVPNVRQAAVPGPTRLTIYSRTNGKNYTLDVSARTVRFSTGEVMDLTVNQTSKMYAAFKNIIATDPVADSLGRLVYGDLGCHPQCPTPYSLPKKGAQTLSVGGNRIQTPFMSSSQVTGTLSLNFSESGTTSSLVTQDALQGDPCTDIVTAAAVAKLNYTSRRTSVLDESLLAGIAEVGSVVGGVIFPEGTAAGALLDTKLLEIITSSGQVNIMAFFWNSHSCSSRQLVTAPIYHIPPGGYTGGTWTCLPQPNSWISIRGGPWISVTVLICEMIQ
jgi:hypothetical protein